MHTHLLERDPTRPVRVMVSVHGTGGSGAEQLRQLRPSAEEKLSGNWLLVCPSFETPYQFLLPDADRVLLDALADLRESHPRLRERLVLHGFSGGAQFAHRFTLKHPKKVVACVAFAAGCWTDPDGTAHGMQIDEDWFSREGWNDPTILAMAKTGTTDPDALRKVQWLIGCGQKDHPSRWRSAVEFHARMDAFGADAGWVDWEGGHEGVTTEVDWRWMKEVDALP
ncbi:MAG: hypothetical protein AAGE65_02185 [Planctomycetota bacterium]